MNEVYKRTLSLLSEISKGPNFPEQPGGRKVPKLFGMKGKHLGSTDPQPDPQPSENPSQDRGSNDVPEVKAGYFNQSPKPKTPIMKRLLNAFMRKFGKRKDNGAR